MSPTGAQLALQKFVTLSKGQLVNLRVRLTILDREHGLSLSWKVMSPAKCAAKRADIHYYGVSFGGLSYEDQVLIHSYVQERLVQESDWLTSLLVRESKLVDKPE